MQKCFIIAGGRDFDDFFSADKFIKKVFKESGVVKKRDIVIISGGARGADKIAEDFSKKYELKNIIMNANWDLNGKAAGHIRNKEMASKSLEFEERTLIAFWDGKSKGTKNMIENANRMKIDVKIFNY